MKVSVVYATARPGGLDILQACMRAQTHTDLEVIIVDELTERRKMVQSGTFLGNTSPPFIAIDPPPKKPGTHWNLSASLNTGCRVASGDLIVLLQDYIWVPEEGIERFVNRMYQEGQMNIITGVGHQYTLPSKIDNPLGLYSVWNAWPGEPCGEYTFIDPRHAKTGFSLTIPVEWEANWSCFPKQAWLDVGGFDEDFDAGWGYDNVNFAERCQLAGYHIWLDTYNEVLCYDHIRLFEEGKHRNSSPNNQALWHRKYRGMAKGGEPWKLNYAGQ